MTFHDTLTRLREAAGYPSARAFFTQHGGVKFFGCTYKQYRNAEAGRSVPSPRIADRIATALRLEISPPAARRFMDTYLRLLLGSDRLAALAFDAGPHGSATSVETAVTKAFANPNRIPPAATEFFYKAPENFWAFIILTNDTGAWSREELARVTGIPPGRFTRPLEALRRFHLAVKGRDGRWRGRRANLSSISAPAESDLPRLHSRMEKYLGYGDGRASSVLRQDIVVRASAADMAHFKPVLFKTLRGSGAFSTTEAGPDTALYVVDGSIVRLTRF